MPVSEFGCDSDASLHSRALRIENYAMVAVREREREREGFAC
jgi:hypothetical protein